MSILKNTKFKRRRKSQRKICFTWPFSLRVCVVPYFGWCLAESRCAAQNCSRLSLGHHCSFIILLFGFFLFWVEVDGARLWCVCGVTGDVFISLSTIFHNHHKDVPYSVVEKVRHWNVASVLLWKSPGKEKNRLTTKKFQQIERSCHFSSFGFSMHSIRCCQSIREWRIVVECLFSYWTFCDDDIVHIFLLSVALFYLKF